MEPSDRQIEAMLVAAPAEQWATLWETVDDLEREDNHATWAGVGEGQLPYVVYSEVVQRTLRAVDDLGLVVPFNWSKWDGIKKYRGGDRLDEATVADAVRMLTAIVRAERFSDGTIAGALGDGTFLAALGRIRRWYELDRRHLSS